MKTVRLEFPVTMLCKTLGVSRSGFHDWLHAKSSVPAQEDARLKVLIKAAHRQSRETYGTRRVKHELAAPATRSDVIAWAVAPGARIALQAAAQIRGHHQLQTRPSDGR